MSTLATAPAALTVPAPTLTGVKFAGGTRFDKPLALDLGPVQGPDGAALDGGARVAYFLYRVNAAGEFIWNNAAQAWQTNPGEDALGHSISPTPMSPAAPGWTATLNAGTLRDATGAPRFTVAPPTQYFIRVLVTAGDPVIQRGLSGPSPMLRLVRVASFNPGVARATWPGGGANAPMDKPVGVQLAPFTLADGSAPAADEVSKVGVFIQRADGLLWHEKQQGWVVPPSDAEAFAALEPLALSPKDDAPAPGGPPPAPSPFQGELIAIGQKDKAGAPRYVPVNDGGGAYRLRGFALVKKAGVVHVGLGAPSADIRFVRLQGEERFGPLFDTDGPQDCTDVRFRLRDGAGQPSGWLRLRSSPRDVELANFDAAGAPLASVRLTAAGDIELHPAPGRQVIVDGDLDVRFVHYQPHAGGVGGGKTYL